MGSSSRRTGASAAAIAAVATSSRCPAERSRGWRAASVGDAEPLEDRRRGRSGRDRGRASVARTSSETVSANRTQLGLLGAEGDVDPGRGARARRRSPDPREGSCTPASARSSVVLPAPLRPITATISPRATSRSIVAERRRLAVGGVEVAGAPASVSPGAGAGLRGSFGADATPSLRASRTVSGTGSQPTRRPRRATGGPTASRRITAAGSPAVTGPRRTRSRGRPSRRPARAGARRAGRSCPWSWTSRCSAAITCSAPCGSSCDVGSSSTRMRGPAASAAAIATRCRSPPESVRTLRAPQRLDVEQIEHLLDASAHVRRIDAEVLHPVRELVLHAVEHERGRRVLRDERDGVGEARGACWSVSRPPTVTRPRSVRR